MAEEIGGREWLPGNGFHVTLNMCQVEGDNNLTLNFSSNIINARCVVIDCRSSYENEILECKKT